jgi:hypothetical protein
MKSKLILCLALVLSGGLVGSCNVARCADGMATNEPVKMKIIEPWKDVTIKLVVPGSTGPSAIKCKYEEIKVKRAVYEIVPNPINGKADYSMLLIHDPYTKKKIFIEEDSNFYVSDNLGMKGFSLGVGDLSSGDSFIELPETNQDDTAIAYFEENLKPEELRQEQIKGVTVNRMVIRDALSQYYTSDGPYAGGRLVMLQVEAVDLTDGILRLDIRNPVTKIPAIVWIDLKAKKVIKSVVNGQEMDLSSSEQNGFAVPLKKN